MPLSTRFRNLFEDVIRFQRVVTKKRRNGVTAPNFTGCGIMRGYVDTNTQGADFGVEAPSEPGRARLPVASPLLKGMRASAPEEANAL
jgi:hypothetical protein